MTSRERVHAALRRQPVDRVPIWMWYQPETIARLAAALEIPPARVADALGDDIRQAWVGNNYGMEGIVHERDGQWHRDPWGVEWVKEGSFNQIRHSPLQDADESAIARYRYPFEQIPALLNNLEPLFAAGEPRFVGCDISPCLFELTCRLRGMEQAILDLAAAPELSRALIAQAGDFSIALAEAACTRFALDWLWTGDDVGSQQDLMMSPRCWREAVRPHLARLFAVGKKHRLWVAYHSCGAIRRIIPDLIEMGLDVLNPLQGTCPGMDPVELKREYGKVLAFMGGVDTQQLLPHGSEEEVYRQTRRLLEAMAADGGGYILAASHTVPPETPLANIFALYRAAGVSREEIGDRAAALRAAASGSGGLSLAVPSETMRRGNIA